MDRTGRVFAVRIVVSDRQRRPVSEEERTLTYAELRSLLLGYAALAERRLHAQNGRRSHWTFRGGLDPFVDVYIALADPA